jgi:hypothetical protein
MRFIDDLLQISLAIGVTYYKACTAERGFPFRFFDFSSFVSRRAGTSTPGLATFFSRAFGTRIPGIELGKVTPPFF